MPTFSRIPGSGIMATLSPHLSQLPRAPRTAVTLRLNRLPSLLRLHDCCYHSRGIHLPFLASYSLSSTSSRKSRESASFFLWPPMSRTIRKTQKCTHPIPQQGESFYCPRFEGGVEWAYGNLIYLTLQPYLAAYPDREGRSHPDQVHPALPGSH